MKAKLTYPQIFQYDGLSRLTAANDDGGAYGSTTTLFYDSLGRIDELHTPTIAPKMPTKNKR